MRRALVIGAAGQDGSYLIELLLEKGYSVSGLVRRNSTPEHQESRLDHVANEIQTFYGDLQDSSNLLDVIKKVNPEEIYNLGAQSHVRISFELPEFTCQTNGIGPLKLLEILRQHLPDSRIYQASSSEMYGDSCDQDGFQRETTPMHPVSPYGCSKLFAYSLVRNYRRAYGLFASNGILFNHESPRRGSNFVTAKVIKSAVEIKLGLRKELLLGNLDSVRDWGHSRDYVRAIHQILTHSKADDFVVATGISKSVRDLVETTFSMLNMNYQEFVKQDSRFMRPQELPYLKGDATKIRKVLGWQPSITFETMIEEMIEFWYSKLYSSGVNNSFKL